MFRPRHLLPVTPAARAIEMLQYLRDAVVDALAVEMPPDRHRIVQHRMPAGPARQTKRRSAECAMHEGAQLPVEMIPVVHIMQPPSDEGRQGTRTAPAGQRQADRLGNRSPSSYRLRASIDAPTRCRIVRPAGCGGRFRSRLIDVADQHHNAPIGCPQYTALTWATGMVDAACVPGSPSVWTFLNRDS